MKLHMINFINALQVQEQALSSTVGFFLLSHHEISGPSGKEQSTKQHRIAEENKFEDFPECPEEAD